MERALRDSGAANEEDPDIAARRAALHTVAHYNAILVALAEGQSVEALDQRFEAIRRFATIAATIGALPTGGFSRFVPAAIPILQQIGGRIEAGRAEATVRQSLIASEDDIRSLFQLLIDDAPEIYDIYVRGQEVELLRLNGLKNEARLTGQADAEAEFAQQITATQERIRIFHTAVGAYTQALEASDAALGDLVGAAEAQRVSMEQVAAIVRDSAVVAERAQRFLNLMNQARQPI